LFISIIIFKFDFYAPGAFFLIALISLVGYVTGLCAPPAQTAQGINYKPVAQV